MNDYKIMKKEAFTVLEKVEQHTVDNEINKNTIPEFWERSWTDGTIKTILNNLDNDNDLLGICYDKSANLDTGVFDYSIAGKCKPDMHAPNGYRVSTIPARTWVIFECVGPMPEAMQNRWHEICTEFIPSSNYEPTFEFNIEAYSAGNMNSQNYKSEIWIPIKENE
ncbi:MAG: GyrI-like domain-containing protein [Clostridium sp.]|nr:GyrI-like domain-containing protein [Clostridium sp.]